jgi:transposase
VRCGEHGVKSIDIPWAGKSSRFTLLFEAFAIRVLLAARSIEEARKLLGLNWHQVNEIKKRAVARGLVRRDEDPIRYIGIDEKQFRRGHSYISSLVDLKGSRVLEVVEDRTEASCRNLLETGLSEAQRVRVEAAALDMWPAFANAVEALLPDAAIVHDRFHISQHLTEAVDKVRRRENKQLIKQGDHRLKGSRYMWLVNDENLDERFQEAFAALKHSDLKVARAWAIKELFRDFWDYATRGWGHRHFNKWYSWAIRSRLEPIKKVARMLKRHLENLLNYFEHRITNAASEGMNSKIQTVKSNARGFRSFEGFRNSVLFYCGGLDMEPAPSH